MTEADARKMFEGMNFDTIKSIRDAASKKIRYLKSQMAINVTVYIPISKRENFDIAKEWAIKNGLVKRTSNWSFVQFCCLNTMELIAKQARAERMMTDGKIIGGNAQETPEKTQDEKGGNPP